VYLNGQQVALLDHTEEFQTAEIPVTLQEGDNQLLLKTNNQQNRDRQLWAIHCALEWGYSLRPGMIGTIHHSPFRAWDRKRGGRSGIGNAAVPFSLVGKLTYLRGRFISVARG
jgi:hypothetical protein